MEDGTEPVMDRERIWSLTDQEVSASRVENARRTEMLASKCPWHRAGDR